MKARDKHIVVAGQAMAMAGAWRQCERWGVTNPVPCSLWFNPAVERLLAFTLEKAFRLAPVSETRSTTIPASVPPSSLAAAAGRTKRRFRTSGERGKRLAPSACRDPIRLGFIQELMYFGAGG